MRGVPIQTHDPGFLTLSNVLSLSRVPLGIAFIAVPEPEMMALIVVVAGVVVFLVMVVVISAVTNHP